VQTPFDDDTVTALLAAVRPVLRHSADTRAALSAFRLRALGLYLACNWITVHAVVVFHGPGEEGGFPLRGWRRGRGGDGARQSRGL
jgi:hypothetical protein